jgi:hypothetical protein
MPIIPILRVVDVTFNPHIPLAPTIIPTNHLTNQTLQNPVITGYDFLWSEDFQLNTSGN